MTEKLRSLVEQWRKRAGDERAHDHEEDGDYIGDRIDACADELLEAIDAMPPQEDLREQIRSLEYKVLMQGRELENKQCIQCAGKLTELSTKVTYRDGREEEHRQWRCAECDESDERTEAALERAEAERDAALAKLALAAVETPQACSCGSPSEEGTIAVNATCPQHGDGTAYAAEKRAYWFRQLNPAAPATPLSHE